MLLHALHLQLPAQGCLDFRHLHRADAHLVQQQHDISCLHEAETGGRDRTTGFISPLESVHQNVALKKVLDLRL